jgi:CheY-like chemotaxis protein
MPAEPRTTPLSVVVVSDNPETLDGLARYLRDAGLSVRGTRAVDGVCELVPTSHAALVFFPDDFAMASVRAALAALTRMRPRALRLLVTSSPQQFAAVEGVHVLPKPVWGWTLLDAIHGRLQRME